MPIKFRCSHCRQLLGIARAKAGQIVDCPTCGRAMRVPLRDGLSEPPPRPTLNLHDPALVSALNELAAIGEISADDNDENTDEEEPGPSTPVVLPAPPLAEPEPVWLEPLPSRPVVAIAPDASAESDESELPTALVELAELTGADAKATPLESSELPEEPQPVAWRSSLITAGVGLVCLLVGYGLGRLHAPGSPPDANAPVEHAAGQGEPQAAPRAALSGRITYRTEAGETRPDAGARVLALPHPAREAEKLNAAGYRPGDPERDFEIARAAIQARGGDAANVAADGTYSLTLAAGTYDVLILSHYQPRSAEEPVAAPHQTVLEAYFERPDQLLGKLAYQLAPLQYSGGETEIRDHSFPPPL